MNRRCGGVISLLCLSFFSANAQQSGSAITNHPITLDVVATDKSGRAIPGLQQQDFTLLDNKVPQKILSFRAVEGASTDPPVEVILVIDEANASFRAVANARQQVTKFLGQEGGELPRPVSMVFFTDAGATIGTTPSQDGKVLIEELNKNKNPLRVDGRSQGFYGAQDRLGLSLRTLGQLAGYEATKPGRKLVVWISPGWAYLSGPNVQLTSKEENGLFNSIVEMSDSLRKARITLYIVDPLGTADAGGFRTFYYEQFVKGVKNPRQVQIANLSLQVLAVQSGGRVLNSTNDVAGEIATCVGDSKAFYVVSFDGQAADGPNDYHALQMKVDRPGVTALTRTGYYAQPERH